MIMTRQARFPRTAPLLLAGLSVVLLGSCAPDTDAADSQITAKISSASQATKPAGPPPIPAVCDELATKPTIGGIVPGSGRVVVQASGRLADVPAFQSCYLEDAASESDQFDMIDAAVSVSPLPYSKQQFDALRAALDAKASSSDPQSGAYESTTVRGVGDAAFYDGSFRIYLLVDDVVARTYLSLMDGPINPTKVPPALAELARLVAASLPRYGPLDAPELSARCVAADDAARSALGAEPEAVWGSTADDGTTCYWGTRKAAVAVYPSGPGTTIDGLLESFDDFARLEAADRAVMQSGRPERIWFDTDGATFELFQFSLGRANHEIEHPLPLADVVPIVDAFAG